MHTFNPEKPIHAGIIVISLEPGSDQLAVVCRKRTDRNADGPGGSLKDQSYPRTYQCKLCHGKAEKLPSGAWEGLWAVIARIANKELDQVTAYNIVIGDEDTRPRVIYHEEKKDKTIVNLLVIRPFTFAQMVRTDISGSPAIFLKSEIGKFEPTVRAKMDENKVIIEPGDYYGVPEGVFKMFDDEIAALHKAFDYVENEITIEKTRRLVADFRIETPKVAVA